jgi:hypothetical protein
LTTVLLALLAHDAFYKWLNHLDRERTAILKAMRERDEEDKRGKQPPAKAGGFVPGN